MASNKPIIEATYIQAQKKAARNRSRRTQRIVSSVVVLLCFVFLIIGGVNVISATSNAYVIVVDGEETVTLVSRNEAESALELCLAQQSEAFMDQYDYDVAYTNEVEIATVSAIGVVYSSVTEAAAALSQVLHFEANATAVLIDDQPAFYVADDTAALELVKAAKDHYGNTDSEDVERIYTTEKVSLAAATVETEDVLNYAEALNMLLYGQLTPPGEGQEAHPLITVNVAKHITQSESLPYQTIRNNNSSMDLGTEEVTTEGVDGVQNVTYYVVMVNDVIVSSEVTGVEVVKPAIDEVVEVGTARNVVTRIAVEGEFTMALAAGSGYNISSYFGYRSRGFHTGVDFAVDSGTAIYASKAGTVTCADWSGGYGYLVTLDHGDGSETRYAHLSEISVSVGDFVEQGMLIAFSGNSGNSTGPHLHFEIRFDGNPVDPLEYLSSY